MYYTNEISSGETHEGQNKNDEPIGTIPIDEPIGMMNIIGTKYQGFFLYVFQSFQ